MLSSRQRPGSSSPNLLKAGLVGRSLVSALMILLILLAGYAQAGFVKVSERGFGNPFNHYSWSMITWDSHIYVGTYNPTEGGEIWRYDGNNWEQVVSGGLTTPENEGFRSSEVFNGALYLGAMNKNGAQLLRSENGTDWEAIMTGGFGVKDNVVIRALQSFGGYLYVGLQNTADGPAQLYRSSDGLNFTPVNLDGFGDPDNNSMHTMTVFKDQLYVATRHRTTPGYQVWRSSNGVDFEIVVGPGTDYKGGFGSRSGNHAPLDLHVFDGRMYIGGADIRGFEVWRTPDGVTYEQVASKGLKDKGNMYSWRFATFDGQIWLGTYNVYNLLFGPGHKGAGLWRSSTGDNKSWEVLVGKRGLYYGYGFDNECLWGIRSFAVFQDKLYIGTACNFDNEKCASTDAGGTEVWEWSRETN